MEGEIMRLRMNGYGLLTFVLLAFVLLACSPTDKGEKGTPNGLINESSPYLLQHAYNPVNWQAWREATTQKAIDADKLMVISIGYASCHWCHVMEKESFSDSAVAALMNDNFVSIKVDREERPDVDQIYMDASMLMTGRGGWPLNVIALPNGKPVYAGTYFPKDNWMQALTYFKDLYQNDRQSLIDQADQVTNGLSTLALVDFNPDQSEFSYATFQDYTDRTVKSIDLRKGGRKGAPKFPVPSVFEALLLMHYHTNNEVALKGVTVTLDQMANGGIYDHLGGGFSRYSTDANWKVPHFEKMLYDNGQLISLYSRGYQATGNPLYQQVVKETIDFLNRELRNANGGYYSSLDADSEGEEGKYYTWQSGEIDELLGSESKIFKERYQVKASGNWEGKNILYKASDEKEKADLQNSRKILLKARAQRVSPPRDDKILTSWNALTTKGLVDAYFAFGEESYLQDALKTAEFIWNNQWQPDRGLNRNYKDGKSSINGFLDDYSFTIEAYIKLYQATFEEKWLERADDLLEYAKAHFLDEETKMFFFTSKLDNDLIARKMEFSDGDIPSSNGSIAHSLFQLGHYYYRESDIDHARQMLNNMASKVEDDPSFYPSWVSLYARMTYPFYEVAIVGDGAADKRNDLFQGYLPNAIIIGGENEGTLELLENKLVEGRTMIYVCENKTCRLPVSDPEKALPLITKSNPRRSTSGG